MKKILYIFLAVLLTLSLGVFLYHTFIANSPVQKKISQEEAEKLCYAVMGEKDEETGFTFSFGVAETIKEDKKEYYVIRASWLVNNSHMSYIGDFFVSVDGKEIYDGWFTPDEYSIGKLIWSE